MVCRIRWNVEDNNVEVQASEVVIQGTLTSELPGGKGKIIVNFQVSGSIPDLQN